MEIDFPEAFSAGLVSIGDSFKISEIDKYIKAAKETGVTLQYWKNSRTTAEIRVSGDMDLSEFKREAGI